MPCGHMEQVCWCTAHCHAASPHLSCCCRRLGEWQAQCNAVRAVRDEAAAAKARAEAEYHDARTQQEAERAERAIREAVAALKVSAAVAGVRLQ